MGELVFTESLLASLFDIHPIWVQCLYNTKEGKVEAAGVRVNKVILPCR